MAHGKRRFYASEFKARAVRLVQEGDRPMAAVARELEISASTLRYWLLQAASGKSAKTHSNRPRDAREDKLVRIGSGFGQGIARRIVRLSLAAGWLLTIILAWHANLLLREQNSLIRSETALTKVQIVQNDAERATYHRDTLRATADTIRAAKTPCKWYTPKAYCLNPTLVADIAWLSQQLEPHHLVLFSEKDTNVGSSLIPRSESLGGAGLAYLSRKRFSRERGQLLETFGREQIVNAIIQTTDVSNEPRLTFESAYLPSGSLYGLDLSGGNLRHAWLVNSQMEGVVAWHAHFDYSNLSEADLQSSMLWGSSFEGADLSGAHLHHADLSECNLSLANLRKANLLKADLSGASLVLADLRGAIFADSNVSDEQLGSACLDHATLQANDRDQLVPKYSPPANCQSLWPPSVGEEAWLSFSSESPPLGALVEVRIASSRGEVVVETAGRWNGETLLTAQGRSVLSGDGELLAWRYPERLLFGKIPD